MIQPELFDVTRTMAATCPVCNARREPGEDRTPACAYDRDRDTARRPTGCLNAVQPQHEQIPY